MSPPPATLPGILSQWEKVTNTAHLLSEWIVTVLILTVALGSVFPEKLLSWHFGDLVLIFSLLLQTSASTLSMFYSSLLRHPRLLSRHYVLNNPRKWTFRGGSIFEKKETIKLLFIQPTPDLKGLTAV